MSGDAAPVVIHADFGHLIDLPGAGPCPRPIDLDRAATGFTELATLRVYSFPAGVTIAGEAEEDEVFMALVRGAADVTLFRDGEAVGDHRLREDGGERALYLPPHAAYRLRAVGNCDVAYARARPAADWFPAPRGFASADGRVTAGDHAVGMTLDLAEMAVGNRMVLADARERFVHARTADAVRLGENRLGDWDTAAITRPAEVATDAAATVLVIAAR